MKSFADDMHFSDRTYMSSFFRKHTGISPSDFRNIDNK
ncbi:MAG: AraC family transcriptional regulator [Bacteroidetes bacterium]|uniref:AraC family transcriptional regulator n=1 Tax=Candidatus Cryptobacteroides faecigallinarum TaxID=2840763 RepID=A0A9D9NHR9_9BACT|nr:AraC family transcriptional regulator [Candidatus Cryptobacteroides faecigallinarum]